MMRMSVEQIELIGTTNYFRCMESLYSHANRRAFLTQAQDSQAHRLTLWLARVFWAPT